MKNKKTPSPPIAEDEINHFAVELNKTGIKKVVGDKIYPFTVDDVRNINSLGAMSKKFHWSISRLKETLTGNGDMETKQQAAKDFFHALDTIQQGVLGLLKEQLNNAREGHFHKMNAAGGIFCARWTDRYNASEIIGLISARYGEDIAKLDKADVAKATQVIVDRLAPWARSQGMEPEERILNDHGFPEWEDDLKKAFGLQNSGDGDTDREAERKIEILKGAALIEICKKHIAIATAESQLAIHHVEGVFSQIPSTTLSEGRPVAQAVIEAGYLGLR